MKKRTVNYKLATLALAIAGLSAAQVQGQTADALINKLVQKGILSDTEGKQLLAESAAQTNQVSASKWKINDAIKNLNLFGDIRLRYEYRGADNTAPGPTPAGTGSTKDDYAKERFRYAVRVGIRGDLYDDFYYGLRLETSSNPRSTWVTFGGDSNPTPSAKNDDGVNIGQAYLGWRPTDWYEMVVGKMPNPLYVSTMLWDWDICPEGAAEKFKYSAGNVDLFATFGQFDYQDPTAASAFPSSDTFMLAWQLGANVKLSKDISFKVAPVLYNYTGTGSGNGLNTPYTGQGLNGLNPNNAPAVNQNGINDLLVLETPAELNFKVGKYSTRLFGDFAYNFYGDDRARAAAAVPGSGLTHAFTDENKAYQVGVGFGNLGLVYGQTSKKNTWEARAYWQHIEQYAVDVNLIDSDFFERANEQGIYSAFSYSITDSIIGTVRYGYANRINKDLGTGGNNPDLPILNPVKNYHIIQLDLTYRF